MGVDADKKKKIKNKYVFVLIWFESNVVIYRAYFYIGHAGLLWYQKMYFISIQLYNFRNKSMPNIEKHYVRIFSSWCNHLPLVSAISVKFSAIEIEMQMRKSINFDILLEKTRNIIKLKKNNFFDFLITNNNKINEFHVKRLICNLKCLSKQKWVQHRSVKVWTIFIL